MKVLALTRYDRTGASSRVRFYQFFNHLITCGIDVTVSPLLGSDYVARLMVKRKKSLANVFGSYLQRAYALPRAKNFDLLWIEKELFPWAPSVLDPGVLCGRPYVVDFDDAVFHNYDEHRVPVLRRLYKDKIPSVMRGASLVVAGNEYIAEFAKQSGARRVEIIPSVVDGERFQPSYRQPNRGFIVGWVGSPATRYLLEPLLPVLQKILDPETDRFVSIGAGFESPIFAAHQNLGWSEESEARLIADFDVGIMPLADAPFERGKCGFKIVQYMAAGLPVVASPVGVNRSMVTSGYNGFLASSEKEWCEALSSLKTSPALRNSMGVASRQRFEERYSFAAQAPRLASLLASATTGTSSIPVT
jgi:glycosyltransferase involved in cell wall biosynthesis